jgi:ketosteroid isomerase-like protein
MHRTAVGRSAQWLLLIGGCVGAAACAAPVSEEGAQRASEIAVRSLAAAWERADTALVEELFWPQATYDDFPNQLTYQGIDEIVGYVTSAHAWGDDVYMNVGHVYAGETHAVAEWVFSAVQNRPLGDAVTSGTGREIVLNGVTIVELENGRIIRAADYTDMVPMMLQLGGRVVMPGGQVIELPPGG